MKSGKVVLFMAFWTAVATAGASPIGDESKAADVASDKAVAAAAATAEKPRPFTPPPGFVAKKRGKLVLYCSTITPIGTRLKTERCFDETQMRDLAIALEENKRDMDRVRSICQNPAVCGMPGAPDGST